VATLKDKILWIAGFALLLGTVSGALAAQDMPNYAYATRGIVSQGIWKVLVDESNLGGKEVQLAEVTIAAGTIVPSHTHQSLEVIYVLSGTYRHEVNGHLFELTPGMVGMVRPGDHARHIASKEGDTRLLVIWTPGGERSFDPSKGVPIAPVVESHDRTVKSGL
jgi:quercetin dioxygenase-like cupin family protein